MKPLATSRPVLRPGRDLLQILWRQPLWAIPFALFFGLLSGAQWAQYVLAYEMSLVFAFTIGLGLWTARHVLLRDHYECPPETVETPVLRLALVYGGVCVVCGYVASAIIHFTLMPGFLGSARAWLVSGMFTLLFTALFSGISFAVRFYEQALARARQVEGIRAELAEAELRALRAQIHPHFLFNTLNTIAALIHQDPAAAEDTTTRLAEVFRYTLRASDHEHARLADELQFVRDYLTIERVRFGDRLRVEERIESGLDSLLVPSLLLQPIVENAVRHGIGATAEGGVLRVEVARSGAGADARLVVRVVDDGPGMGEAAPSGNGFGLRSVRERLELAGPPHDLQIRSTPGHGVAIEITLPIRTAAPPAPSTRSSSQRGVS